MTEPIPNSVAGRLFRGYGPLAGFAALLLAVSLFVPTQRQEIRTEAAGVLGTSQQATDPSGVADTALGATDGTTGTAAPGATGAAGTGTARAGTAGGTTKGTTKSAVGATNSSAGSRAGAASGGGAGAGGPVAPRGGCADRKTQDPNDPYSPPCFSFNGNNGGATSRGVSGDKITVAVRLQGFQNGVLDALSRVAKANIPDEPTEKIVSTVNGLTEYINRTYQFYGRKFDVKIFTGQGELEREMLGSGSEAAAADALKVSKEIQAFADVTGVSPPYVDALARQGVVSIGAPYMSPQWLTARRPFAWSQFTDCATIVRAAASYYLAKLSGKPAAYAGGALKGQPRKTAVIAPDNSWYQECATAGRQIVKDAGKGNEIPDDLNLQYRLDINAMGPQATSLIAKLKDGGATTVLCGCDPLILTFLTGKAREQNYQPEWVETGVALSDQDLIGQIFDPAVWDKAFGVSFAGPTQQFQQTTGYRAFKAVRPNEEPSFGVDIIFRQLQMLALGVQMAGPNLTPQTFETGMFQLPSMTGYLGTWKFGPNDYTTSQDAREVYWDSRATSVYNGKPGAWIDPNGGARYPIGGFPAGEPNVPR
jgi:hypothetical protein